MSYKQQIKKKNENSFLEDLFIRNVINNFYLNFLNQKMKRSLNKSKLFINNVFNKNFFMLLSNFSSYCSNSVQFDYLNESSSSSSASTTKLIRKKKVSKLQRKLIYILKIELIFLIDNLMKKYFQFNASISKYKIHQREILKPLSY